MTALDRCYPQDMLPGIDEGTEQGAMLAMLCRRHPLPVHRDDLIFMAKLRGRGPIGSYAAFHWHILRINDRLPQTGWKVQGDGREAYRLVPA